MNETKVSKEVSSSDISELVIELRAFSASLSLLTGTLIRSGQSDVVFSAIKESNNLLSSIPDLKKNIAEVKTLMKQRAKELIKNC